MTEDTRTAAKRARGSARTRARSTEPADLARELRDLRDAMLALEARYASVLAAIAEDRRPSARNLLHYLAMRRQDLRQLQTGLARVGLSSIGRSEAHALWSVGVVLALVERLAGAEPGAPAADPPCDLQSGTALLEAHTRALLGPEPGERSVRIMVTMPTEAASDYTMVRRLLEAGMDCMRINCAHDGPDEWLGMIENLRQARRSLGRSCRVLMDLAGPKLRTGAVEPGPAVVKLRPERDPYGRVRAPARVWLTPAGAPVAAPSPADGVVHVEDDWLAGIEPLQMLHVRDTRGRARELLAIDRDRGGVWCEIGRTVYLTNGLVLETESRASGERVSSPVSGILPTPGALRIVAGDLLILTREPLPGRGASFDSAGRLLSPARVSCTLPEVFADVLPGHRVCLDDGHIIGVAEAVSGDEIRVRVQRTPSRGAKLSGDKGINLPDSPLRLPALTTKDIEDLRFVARHADLVGLSFANAEDDVRALVGELRKIGGKQPGIIIKIETRRGFERLPAMLLAAMGSHPVGVMIARGDLAVECGYERLAEAQEEILWICEAAHCPAIWATQVLESLAKEGIPSRSEITDAAMGHRAECIMLNKGPHVDDAVRVLDDILRRMDTHQSKKRAMLRALRLASGFEAVAR
jgi:pyruvate kinase